MLILSVPRFDWDEAKDKSFLTICEDNALKQRLICLIYDNGFLFCTTNDSFIELADCIHCPNLTNKVYKWCETQNIPLNPYDWTDEQSVLFELTF